MIKTLLFSTAAAAAFALPGHAEPLSRFDVAEDLSRFVYASDHRFEDEMPAFGNAFLTQGYIYPEGTLDGGIEGTLADGSPAFPSKVLGTWTCDGYFVGEGIRTKTGTIVITRQVFQFNDGSILISQGPEIIDEGVVVERAVTGGTGDYAEAPSTLRQVLLGMSDGFGVRLQYELEAEASDLKKAELTPDLNGVERDPTVNEQG